MAETELKLPENIDPARLPAHIAIIMDGNGRWAKKRGLPRAAGHRAGALVVEDMAEACSKIGVKALTLYAFSTENWSRPAAEVSLLMDLLCDFLDKKRERMRANNIRLAAIGRLDALPEKARARLEKTISALSSNTGLVLSLALNYGGRQEIADAVRRAQADGIKDITEADISARLYTSALPEVDLIIRTSGEKRLSNFLLWQAAYAEFYFTETFWPDFKAPQLFEALADYQKRERRFGGLAA